MLTRYSLASLWTQELLVNKTFKQTKHKLASLLMRGTLASLWTQNKQTNNMIESDHVIYELRSVSAHKEDLKFKGIFRFRVSNCHFDFPS